jgi:hypothetical protein
MGTNGKGSHLSSAAQCGVVCFGVVRSVKGRVWCQVRGKWEEVRRRIGRRGVSVYLCVCERETVCVCVFVQPTY